MIAMTLIYLAGVVSGAVLLTIALWAWIALAATKIKDRTTHGRKAPRPGRHRDDERTDTGTAPVAIDRARRRRRGGSTAATAA